MPRCNAKRPPPAWVAEAAVSQGRQVFRVCSRVRLAYDDLLQARITSRHIHVLANHSVALEQLPEASLLQSSDVVALTLAGAGFGAWTATMIGVDEPNARLERFRGAIRDGQLLIMADVPGSREHEIEQMVAQHFPKADLEGAEPTTPIFP